MDIYEKLKSTYEGMLEIENGGGAAPKKNIQTITEMKQSIVYFGDKILHLVRFIGKWRISQTRI